MTSAFIDPYVIFDETNFVVYEFFKNITELNIIIVIIVSAMLTKTVFTPFFTSHNVKYV
jgi:hypothetical protein